MAEDNIYWRTGGDELGQSCTFQNDYWQNPPNLESLIKMSKELNWTLHFCDKRKGTLMSRCCAIGCLFRSCVYSRFVEKNTNDFIIITLFCGTYFNTTTKWQTYIWHVHRRIHYMKKYHNNQQWKTNKIQKRSHNTFLILLFVLKGQIPLTPSDI